MTDTALPLPAGWDTLCTSESPYLSVISCRRNEPYLHAVMREAFDPPTSPEARLLLSTLVRIAWAELRPTRYNAEAWLGPEGIPPIYARALPADATMAALTVMASHDDVTVPSLINPSIVFATQQLLMEAEVVTWI